MQVADLGSSKLGGKDGYVCMFPQCQISSEIDSQSSQEKEKRGLILVLLQPLVSELIFLFRFVFSFLLFLLESLLCLAIDLEDGHR